MSTLSEIGKSVHEIRRLLKHSLTPDFFKSIKDTSESINRTLGDPSLPGNVKLLLENFNSLLTEAKDKGLMDESMRLIAEVRTTLGVLNSENTKQILENVTELLKSAKEANLIQHFTDALDSAKSIGEFFDLANKVMAPVANVTQEYGIYVPIIGTALYLVASSYLGKSGERELIALSRENKEISAHSLLIHLQTFRAIQLAAIDRIDRKIQKSLYASEEQMKRDLAEREYAERVVQAIPHLDPNTLAALSCLNKKLEELLIKFVEEKIQKESVSQTLDYIGISYEKYWDDFLRYAVYSHQSLPFTKRIKSPELSHFERHYSGICSYYGKAQIQPIMLKLAGKFSEMGGMGLYNAVRDSFENEADIFLNFAKYVSAPEECQIDLEKQPPYIQMLSEYFHRGAEIDICRAWRETQWPSGLEYLAQQMDIPHEDEIKTIKLIKIRAFSEFCNQNAKYFFGIRSVLKDTYLGLLDGPKGIIAIVKEPRLLVKGFANLTKLSGWTSLGRSVVNRPIRVAVSIAPSLVAGGLSAHSAFIARKASTLSQLAVPATNIAKKASILPQMATPATAAARKAATIAKMATPVTDVVQQASIAAKVAVPATAMSRKVATITQMTVSATDITQRATVVVSSVAAPTTAALPRAAVITQMAAPASAAGQVSSLVAPSITAQSARVVGQIVQPLSTAIGTSAIKVHSVAAMTSSLGGAIQAVESATCTEPMTEKVYTSTTAAEEQTHISTGWNEMWSLLFKDVDSLKTANDFYQKLIEFLNAMESQTEVATSRASQSGFFAASGLVSAECEAPNASSSLPLDRKGL